MEALQLSLLGLGLVVVVLLWVGGRARRKRSENPVGSSSKVSGKAVNKTAGKPVEPSINMRALDGLDDLDDLPDVSMDPQSADAVVDERKPGKPSAFEKAMATPSDAPEMVIALTVMAQQGDRFEGPDLLRSFHAHNLKPNNLQVFYRPDADGVGSLFTVANVVKPGTLAETELTHDFSTPGVAFFLRLPVAIEGDEAFDQMLKTADALARDLGGEVRDERRNPLSAQALQQKRDVVREFLHEVEVERRRAEQKRR
jgi:cell division protein ZipA